MINNLKKWVVILIGPPGSGKDTQADLLAHELGLEHIRTSGLIEKKFSEGNLNDLVLKHEKELWASGQLNSRDFVFGLVSEKVKKLNAEGKEIIFSGSPREKVEAEMLMALLEEMYGRDAIAVIRIKLSEEESIKRNSHRRICKANRHPIPNFLEYENVTACPWDGSEILTRTLDDPETIKKRYEVYKKQTEEVFDFLTKSGYNIIEVNGEQAIEDVHRDILNKLW